MSKKLIRLLTLVMAIAMVASLAVGCGGNSNTPGGNKDGVELPSGIQADVNPEDYKGTTVVYASWKNPWENEDGPVIDAFVEKYGINVEWSQVDQGSYVSIIASSIASNKQADVFFENGSFPGSLTVMQPLDAAKLDLTSDVWNKTIINKSTVDGHAYLVDVLSNVWTETNICVYNKNIFESNGIKTPKEYYDEGKWTFANFRIAASEVAALGKEYVGAAVSAGESLQGAAGCSVFTYKDNKMVTTVDDRLIDVMTFMSQMRVDGLMKNDRSGFGKGKTGMAITDAFGLKKTGYFSEINPDHIAATYVPVWKEGEQQVSTGIYRGWGLIDGAKNPVAAGIFLREYLDVANYSISDTFLNDEVATFFFEVTGKVSENMVYYHGAGMASATGIGSYAYSTWDAATPSGIKSAMDARVNTLNEMCDIANGIIEDERKWIKDAEEKGTIEKLSK